MNDLAPVLIMAIIILGVYRIFELYVRRNERMAIIEKLSSGIDPEALKGQITLPSYKNGSSESWPIRIGLLLVGVGLGVLIATIIDLNSVIPPNTSEKALHEFRNTISVLFPACASLFGGIGLIIAYFIEKKNEKK